MLPGRAMHRATGLLIALATSVTIVMTGATGAIAAGEREEAARLFAEGQSALAARRVSDAAALLGRAARLAPDVPQVRFAHAVALTASGRDGDAFAEFEAVLALDPRHAGAWNGIGNLHNRRRDPSAALDAFVRAMELDPDLLVAAWNAGWTAEQIERLDLAERAYRACLAAPVRASHERTHRLEARFRLGALRYRARDYSAAASLMREVVRDEPDHPRAHHYLGQALVRLGRRDEGRRHLERHRELVEGDRTGSTVADSGSR